MLAIFLLFGGTTSLKTIKKQVIQHQSVMLLRIKYKSPALLNEQEKSLEQNQTDATEGKSRFSSGTLSRENTFVVCKTATKTLKKAGENGISLSTMTSFRQPALSINKRGMLQNPIGLLLECIQTAQKNLQLDRIHDYETKYVCQSP